MLKAILTAEEFKALPDVLKKEYVEADGAHRLDVGTVNGWGLEDVGGLKKALQSERETNTEAKKVAEAFKGVDPAKAREALAKVGEMANWTPEQKVKEQIDATTKQLTEKHTGELAAAKAEGERYLEQLKSELIDSAATSAIASAKGNVDLLLPHVRGRITTRRDESGKLVARVLDDTGAVRVSMKQGNSGPMSIGEFVESMRSDAKYKVCFTAVDKSGAGTRTDQGGGGGGGKELTSREKLKAGFSGAT